MIRFPIKQSVCRYHSQKERFDRPILFSFLTCTTPHKIQCSTTKQKNRCRRQQRVTTWRVLCDDRRTLHESPGSRVEVSGGHFDKIQAKPPCIFAAAPWCFSPGFSRKAGKNQGSFALDLIEQSPGLFDLRGQRRNQGGFALD